MACEILVPQPGMKPVPPVVEAWVLTPEPSLLILQELPPAEIWSEASPETCSKDELTKLRAEATGAIHH